MKMNTKEWQILKKDLQVIEKGLTGKDDFSLRKEEQFIDLLLRNEAENIRKKSSWSLNDEEMGQIWESTEPEALPSSLTTRVFGIIGDMTAKKQQVEKGYLFAPARVALAFRKEAQLEQGEADLIQSAVERAKERLRSQEGEEE